MPEPNPILKRLIEANAGFVHALALRLAPAPGLADDIAQQVFLEFIGKASQWDLTEDIKPLLAGMTRNVARRAWREKSHNMPEVVRELADHIRDLAENSEVSWFDEEEKNALRRCLDKLPAKSRRLIDFHYDLGITSVEIAGKMEMNADAVRRALFRLRERLRKCVGRLLYETSMNESTGRREIESLIQGYLEESLTEDESRRLLASLRRDSSLVTTILENLRTDSLIRAVVSDIAAVEDVDQEDKILSVPQPAEISPAPTGPSRRRKHWPEVLALAACLALLVGLSVWFFGPTMGEPVLAGIQGVDVSIERGTEFVPAANGIRLQPADVLRVGTNDTATIVFGRENTRIELRASTQLKVLSWGKGKRFELREGRIEATVAPQPKEQPMVWQTAQAEATVVGTEFILSKSDDSTRCEVMQGTVKLTSKSSGQSIQLTNSQYAVAAPGIELKAEQLPEGRGNILREYWLDIGGNNVGELTRHTNYPNKFSGLEYVSRFAGPTDWAINYGARFQGYLYPPKTGLFTFWITAKESAQLWLSPDEGPERAEMIASLHISAPSEYWDTYPWQKSDPIKLVAGRKYYIEVLHKADDKRGDHCSVAWQPPGAKREVISGQFLSPFKPKK